MDVIIDKLAIIEDAIVVVVDDDVFEASKAPTSTLDLRDSALTL